MNEFINVLKTMSLAFFANGKHKITAEKLFESKDAVFLDVRSKEEVESIAFPLRFQAECIHVPTDEIVFLDVRSKEEVESIAFPLRFQAECIHVPTDEIPDRLLEIPKDKPIGIFCSAGTRSAIVYAFLRANGYDNVKIIVGGCGEIINMLKPGKIWKAVK